MMSHKCGEESFQVRVLHGVRGFEHVVKYNVRRGLVSMDIWLEETRTFGGHQTVKIVGVKRLPMLTSTMQTVINANTAKKELDIIVKEAVKEGWTVVQSWSKMDRKVVIMVDYEVDLPSCIVFNDDDSGFHKSVKMEVPELNKFPCDEGFLKFLMDL